MNARVLELLQRPENISREDISLLQNEISKFPYMQSPQNPKTPKENFLVMIVGNESSHCGLRNEDNEFCFCRDVSMLLLRIICCFICILVPNLESSELSLFKCELGNFTGKFANEDLKAFETLLFWESSI